jgi:hypothetical protein
MKLKFIDLFGIVHFSNQNQPTLGDNDRNKLHFPITFWKLEHHYSRSINIDFLILLLQGGLHDILNERPFYSIQINFQLYG